MTAPDTTFTARAGIRYPIIQAPIGSATTAALAAAVSNAGGLGSLALSWRSPAETADEVREALKRTTRPVAVNVVLEWPQEERVRIALDQGVRIIWTFWGDPAPLVSVVHDAGALVMHAVGSVEEGRRAVAAGVDVVVAQGVEAGGHVRGTEPWRELLGGLLDQIPGVPVLVAGGMAEGTDLAEALRRGAAAACFGTRFLCAIESGAAPSYRDAIVRAGPGDTVLTGLFDKGWPNAPHRVLRNSTVRAWEAAGSPRPGARPGETDVVAVRPDGQTVERYADVIPTPDLAGNLEALALYAGDSSARVTTVQPTAAIIAELVRDAGLAAW